MEWEKEPWEEWRKAVGESWYQCVNKEDWAEVYDKALGGLLDRTAFMEWLDQRAWDRGLEEPAEEERTLVERLEEGEEDMAVSELGQMGTISRVLIQ